MSAKFHIDRRASVSERSGKEVVAYPHTSADRSPLVPSTPLISNGVHIAGPVTGTRETGMKTKLLCIGILAMAASFGAAAQETSRNITDPTASCIGALAGEPRLKLIADKMSPAQGMKLPERAATADERAAFATLVSMRKGCFDAGTPYRRVRSTPQ